MTVVTWTSFFKRNQQPPKSTGPESSGDVLSVGQLEQQLRDANMNYEEFCKKIEALLNEATYGEVDESTAAKRVLQQLAPFTNNSHLGGLGGPDVSPKDTLTAFPVYRGYMAALKSSKDAPQASPSARHSS